MRRIFLIAAMALAALPLAGQAPDDEAIRAVVFDPASRYYYPPLMARYMRGDTTLTANDYHHLYYGFAMRDEYLPLDPVPGETDLMGVVERAGVAMTADDAALVLAHGRRVMERDPFSPATINLMAYACGVLGDTEGAKACAARLSGVLGAIAATGDGKREKTAWHVIFFSHVNDFLAAHGLEVRGRRVVSRSVEFAALMEPAGRDKGYYFDFGRAYSRPPSVLPTKPKGIRPRL